MSSNRSLFNLLFSHKVKIMVSRFSVSLSMTIYPILDPKYCCFCLFPEVHIQVLYIINAIEKKKWHEPHVSLTPSLCRGCPAHSDGGDVLTAAVSGQCRSDHPALLTALPLHQHVALQQAGDGHGFGPVLSLLGGHSPTAAQPHWGLGRETGTWTRRWLPPQ